MPDQKAHTTERYTSSKVIFLQDVTLSALASLLSILLIRWISEPIPGFTAIVVKWLLGALVGSIIGLLLSGLTLIVRRYLSYGIVSKLATAVLVKEVALVLTAIFLIKFPSAALAVTALVVDVLLTAIALAWPRYTSMILRKEERAITNLSAKKTALIFGTSKESVRLAEDSEQSGRYTVLGFLSDDPSLAGRVISDHEKIVCFVCLPSGFVRIVCARGETAVGGKCKVGDRCFRDPFPRRDVPGRPCLQAFV